MATLPVSPRFSKGTDETTAVSSLQSLLSSEGGRWTLTSEGEALERSFKFKTFAKTWDFMTAVSLQCKVYNTTFIRWTTHNPKGLSTKDFELASLCDSIAKDFGEVEPEPVTCEIRNLVDSATVSAGDCCTPKK
ncbi:unnamed protein product [Clonostachys solani]|uniref:4a-hydroxytetrahydrobiopterin dehydratase n=1 Tax=Clonostachys solani TaxID=160281 RepID=A0A9N9Z4P4_9HYPO|nr:unnamed protein product [Clonostachys solani]